LLAAGCRTFQLLKRIYPKIEFGLCHRHAPP
jgi:hypothetical protein